MLTVRHATRSDAEWFGANLREEDEEEVRAATGQDPVAVLPSSFDLSRECYVAYWRDSAEPCVIFGVSDDPSQDGLGIVWLLATPQVSRCGLSVLRTAHAWLDYMSRLYPLGMHNLAWENNALHIRWCQASGFKELGAFELRGHRFIHIHRLSNV